VDSAYSDAWLERRNQLACKRQQQEEVCDYHAGRYSATLKLLGNLLATVGEAVLVNTRPAPTALDEGRVLVETLVPCPTATEDLLIAYAEMYGWFEPSLDEL
jgi:hypothetical protein